MNQQELKTALRRQAAQIDRMMEHDLRAIADCPQLPDILQHALFNGGKRIRPLLCVAAGQLLDHDAKPADDLLQLAITFEYLHVASLLHDDVIDHADQRRGRQVANAVWGNSFAILAGDYLHARAMTLAGTVGGPECLAIIGQATAAMVEAEFLQAAVARRGNSTMEEYTAICSGKTAALIAAACETGIALRQGSAAQRQALATYGNNLGMAFQIIDDILDYQGDSQRTGKVVGNDWQEGKMTLPLLLAMEQETVAGRLADLRNESATNRRAVFPQARELIAQGQGFRLARERANALMQEAMRGLAPFNDRPSFPLLAGLATYVLSRDK